MATYILTPDGLYPVATVRGASADQLAASMITMLADEESPLARAFRRYFVSYGDGDGNPMPENAVFQMRLSDAGDLIDFTQNLWVTVASGARTLDFTAGLWVFTGTSTATWTLPTTQSAGEEFIIKNRGTATVTLSRGGSQQLYTSSAVNTVPVTAGSTVRVVWDGTYWVVV